MGHHGSKEHHHGHHQGHHKGPYEGPYQGKAGPEPAVVPPAAALFEPQSVRLGGAQRLIHQLNGEFTAEWATAPGGGEGRGGAVGGALRRTGGRSIGTVLLPHAQRMGTPSEVPVGHPKLHLT